MDNYSFPSYPFIQSYDFPDAKKQNKRGLNQGNFFLYCKQINPGSLIPSFSCLKKNWCAIIQYSFQNLKKDTVIIICAMNINEETLFVYLIDIYFKVILLVLQCMLTVLICLLEEFSYACVITCTD